MIKDNAGEILLVDGQRLLKEEAMNYVTEGSSVYEVVRIIGGKPLFLKEHVERLENSFKALNINVPEQIKDIGEKIVDFSAQAGVLNGNLKIICDRIGGPETRTIIYEASSRYPERTLYERGVAAVTLKKSRTLPGAKTIEDSLRAQVEKVKLEKKAFEVILVDGGGNITEGSRSNIFFFKDRILHTPPMEKVLPGITRMKVFEFCAKKAIEVRVHPISRKDISNFDGAFLTGTSINMLPVKTIDEIEYSVSGFAVELSSQFERHIIEAIINA